MIVVTGAAGFIGRHVVAELHRRGQRVAGIDRRPGADHIADLTRDLEVLDLLREADGVIHLAGAAGVRRSGPGAEAAWWRDNVQATEAVLAATPSATPLAVASSSSVYGGSRGRPSSETDLLRPHGGYARSKVEVEHRCADRTANGGHVAVARPFTVAGEGQRHDMALHRWLHAARRGEPLTILGSVHRRRDVTDVHQVAFALAELAERDVTGPVNVGTGKSHSLSDLVAAVERVVGPVDVVVKAAGQSEVEATLADTARCRRLLGFVPRTNLEELVRRQARAASLLEPEVVEQVVGA